LKRAKKFSSLGMIRPSMAHLRGWGHVSRGFKA
jgi:hypothetical protein